MYVASLVSSPSSSSVESHIYSVSSEASCFVLPSSLSYLLSPRSLVPPSVSVPRVKADTAILGQAKADTAILGQTESDEGEAAS